MTKSGVGGDVGSRHSAEKTDAPREEVDDVCGFVESLRVREDRIGSRPAPWRGTPRI